MRIIKASSLSEAIEKMSQQTPPMFDVQASGHFQFLERYQDLYSVHTLEESFIMFTDRIIQDFMSHVERSVSSRIALCYSSLLSSILPSIFGISAAL